MRPEYAAIVGRREYLARIRSKGFWIATVAVPLFIGAVVLGPQLLLARTTTELRLAVVDAAGTGLGRELAAALTASARGGRRPAQVRFEVRLVPPAAAPGGGQAVKAVKAAQAAAEAAQRRELDAMVRRREIGAWVWIGRDALATSSFEYHAESLSNVITQEVLKARVSEVVGRWRLRQAGYDAAKVAALMRPLELETVRISATGSRAEAGAPGFFLAFALFFILYMTIMIYGNQVMQGVLEEKGSRVIEVLASAVKPTELMAGKLGGICLLALTQLAIWAAAIAAVTTPGLLAVLVAAPGRLPVLQPALWINFFLLFLCGFFLFATFYAILGAAFNSAQEAQQLAGLPAIFVVAPAVFMVSIINDPDSALAVGLSLVPPLTPLVMMLRISTRMPPLWQLLTAYGLCAAAIAGMIWLCARVYRVGILMYGKKPTLQEIWRWVRYT
jgi:ABC-2 type transport system permease protein